MVIKFRKYEAVTESGDPVTMQPQAKMVCVSKEYEEQWKNVPLRTKKYILKIIQENIKETYIKIEKECADKN